MDEIIPCWGWNKTSAVKSCSFGSRVSIFLKKCSPIILEYKIDHIDGILKYYIAPKSGD